MCLQSYFCSFVTYANNIHTLVEHDCLACVVTGLLYNGTNDVSVRVDNTGSVAVIYAEGEAVAFIEFGAGDRYGHGHPQAGDLGMGPGTYPSDKGLWNNPKGWWYGHSQHTYGNPPAMAMYQAVQAITEQVTTIAKEVFRA